MGRKTVETATSSTTKRQGIDELSPNFKFGFLGLFGFVPISLYLRYSAVVYLLQLGPHILSSILSISVIFVAFFFTSSL